MTRWRNHVALMKSATLRKREFFAQFSGQVAIATNPLDGLNLRRSASNGKSVHYSIGELIC